MADKVLGLIKQINNGFLFVSEDGDSTYMETFDIPALTAVSHEKHLHDLVYSFAGNQKIPAIKAVRDWCSTHKFDKYVGLKDAKDYVESIRDWYYFNDNGEKVYTSRRP